MVNVGGQQTVREYPCEFGTIVHHGAFLFLLHTHFFQNFSAGLILVQINISVDARTFTQVAQFSLIPHSKEA